MNKNVGNLNILNSKVYNF